MSALFPLAKLHFENQLKLLRVLRSVHTDIDMSQHNPTIKLEVVCHTLSVYYRNDTIKCEAISILKNFYSVETVSYLKIFFHLWVSLTGLESGPIIYVWYTH